MATTRKAPKDSTAATATPNVAAVGTSQVEAVTPTVAAPVDVSPLPGRDPVAPDTGVVRPADPDDPSTTVTVTHPDGTTSTVVQPTSAPMPEQSAHSDSTDLVTQVEVQPPTTFDRFMTPPGVSELTSDAVELEQLAGRSFAAFTEPASLADLPTTEIRPVFTLPEPAPNGRVMDLEPRRQGVTDYLVINHGGANLIVGTDDRFVHAEFGDVVRIVPENAARPLEFGVIRALIGGETDDEDTDTDE